MSLLVRRDVVIAGGGPEIDAVAAAPHPRLGQPWLEEVEIAFDGKPSVGATTRITPEHVCDSWGRWDPTGRELVLLRRRTLASLWGDPFADYLLQSQPDVFHASSGGMWLRDDVWRGSALLSAEWLPSAAVAWSRDGRRIAFTSIVPHTWNRGTHVITVIDLPSGAVTRFGPWEHGDGDVLEWTPSSGELLSHVRSGGEDRVIALDVERGTFAPLDVPSETQGLAFSPAGDALAVAHGGEAAGIAVFDAEGRLDYPVGPAWTPVWPDGDHLLFGAPEDEPNPGDLVVALRLDQPAMIAVLTGEHVDERTWTSVRVSDWRGRRGVPARPWWSSLIRTGEAAPAPRLVDPRALGAQSAVHVAAELDLLFYDDPELYAAHAHLRR